MVAKEAVIPLSLGNETLKFGIKKLPPIEDLHGEEFSCSSITNLDEKMIMIMKDDICLDIYSLTSSTKCFNKFFF